MPGGSRRARLAERLEGLVDGVVAQRLELEASQEARVPSRLRLDGMSDRLEQLQPGLDAALARVESESAMVAQVKDDLTRTEAQLGERLERLAEDAGTLRSDLEAAVEGRVEQARTTLEQEVARTSADVLRALVADEELNRVQEELRRGLETMTGA